MKKLLLLLAVLMTAVLLFASCGTEIENGEIDIDDETIAALPCSVDVEGLEGVSGTVSVDLVTEAEKTDALSKVKEGYYVADGAATYAVEISLKKDGEDVAPGKPITVKIGLKTHDLPLDQYTVFHIHGDRVTEIVPTVTEDSLTFSVSDFSIFLVVPKHVHTPGALVVDTPATCTATGTGHIPCSVCGKTVEDKTIDKTAHAPGEWIDDAAAGKSYKECTVCHNRVEEKPYTPPVADNWDADLIAAAFRAVGATKDVTLPKLDCVKSMTKSDVVGGKVTVTILTASGSAARQAANQYKGQTIPRAFENTRYEGNFDYYLTAHNEAEFGIFVNDGNGTVTIEITAFEPAYPESAISALLTGRGVTDGIVEFKNENAVEYVWDDGTLYVSLRYDADASAVMQGFVDALTRTAGYGTDLTTNGKTVYVSENEQIVFYLTTDRLNGRARVAVSFLDASVLPIREYPADLIASLLDGTNDDFFNFGQANATEYRPIYHAGDFEGTFHVYLPAKEGQDGAAAAEAIYNGFVALGYLNNDLRFTYGDENCRRDGLVSPDREILVRVTGYDAQTMIKWGYDGTYTYAVVEIVNLTMVENLAWVTSIEVTPNVTRYNLGAGFYFDANVSAVFSNGKREMIPSSSGAVEIPAPPDTDTEGVKTVTVVYLGTFTDTYQITVSDVVTGINATGFTTTWYLNDVWSFDGTLTAIWEKKGVQPLSVDDVTFYPAPDMTTVGTKHVTVTLKTDETISASVDFVVKSRTVSFKYRNTDEWDITEGYAKFAVYAIGGDFNRSGKWVNVGQSRGVFTGSVDKDTTSFYIVRLSAETDVFEEGVNYDLESEGVLNVSDALTIPEGSAGDVPTFSFGEP